MTRQWGEMQARDLMWLAILGCVERGTGDIDQIIATIDGLGGPAWRPSPDMLIGCIEEMSRGGHLCPSSSQAIRMTGKGRETLSFLLNLPVPSPVAPLGQAGVRIKLAFLDLLDSGQREGQFRQMVAAYETELWRCRVACGDCATRGCFGKLWQQHDAERLDRDLALLRSMAGMAASDALH